MNLHDKLTPIIELAAQQSMIGAGELPQEVFDRAAEILKDVKIVSAISKHLNMDSEAFFTIVAVCVGVVAGMRERLQGFVKESFPGEIPQTDAYALVDLWGRVVGIKAMLYEIARECDLIAIEGLSERFMKARMAAIFIMLERTVVDLSAEISRNSALAAVGPGLDGVMTIIKAERKGPFGQVLQSYLSEL